MKPNTPRSSVLTPDFYDYEWMPLQSASAVGDFVELRWADGTSMRAFKLWLRENAVGAGGVDVATREGILDPSITADDVVVGAVAVDAHGSLQVTWLPDGAQAVYHPGWLRHVAEGRHLPSSWLPEPVVWTAVDLKEPPSRDGANVLTDETVLHGWVDDLLRYGLARLRNLPNDVEIGRQIAERFGPLRDTNFGRTWDVKSDIAVSGDPHTNSTANTTIRLAPHTDLPTRETPPGFQFLHCLENTTVGGQSTMTDGAAVARHIEQSRPEYYDALTNLRWVFFNRGQGVDHRWSGPIIDPGMAGTPLTFRAFYPVRAFPDMDDADVPRAYEALAYFSEVAADERFQLRYPFKPGDLVGFDNRRILHGRDGFTAGGTRHLRGLYIDHDEIRSFARVAKRQQVATGRI